MSLIFVIVFLAATQPPPSSPPVREMPSSCRCAESDRAGALSFTGVVIDAELRLAVNGRDPDSRQATVFRTSRADSKKIPELVKVWHVTDPSDCGVVFDYGRRYLVVVKDTEDGFETDYCIDPRYQDQSAAPESGTSMSDGDN